ncbi:hypothetical protein ACIQ6Y_19340 [Streptomyces sp. NPDC096205]|uniref:hypothetical protein n=1 Tax=Streptomyces sp. NPDC096205 TaxID=3366081 RepID=UPI0037FDC967
MRRGQCLQLTGKVIEGWFSCSNNDFGESCFHTGIPIASSYRYFSELANGSFINEKHINYGS